MKNFISDGIEAAQWAARATYAAGEDPNDVVTDFERVTREAFWQTYREAGESMRTMVENNRRLVEAEEETSR